MRAHLLKLLRMIGISFAKLEFPEWASVVKATFDHAKEEIVYSDYADLSDELKGRR